MGKGKSFLAGALTGSAALFLSKKENRDLIAKKAKKIGNEAKKEAEAIKKKVTDAAKKVTGKKKST